MQPPPSLRLRNDVFAHVASQDFGNKNGTIGLLEVFDKRHQDARCGNCGGVQRVHESRFAFFVFIARIEPPCLEVVKV